MILKDETLGFGKVLEGLLAILEERGLQSFAIEKNRAANAFEKSLPLMKKIARENGLKLNYNVNKVSFDDCMNEMLNNHLGYLESPPNSGLHICLGDKDTDSIINGKRKIYEMLADELERRYKAA
jgi:hypothetical protein